MKITKFKKINAGVSKSMTLTDIPANFLKKYDNIVCLQSHDTAQDLDPAMRFISNLVNSPGANKFTLKLYIEDLESEHNMLMRLTPQQLAQYKGLDKRSGEIAEKRHEFYTWLVSKGVTITCIDTDKYKQYPITERIYHRHVFMVDQLLKEIKENKKGTRCLVAMGLLHASVVNDLDGRTVGVITHNNNQQCTPEEGLDKMTQRTSFKTLCELTEIPYPTLKKLMIFTTQKQEQEQNRLNPYIIVSLIILAIAWLYLQTPNSQTGPNQS